MGQGDPIRVMRHVWVPARDGCRLAARVWLPEDAEEHPVPAIFEYHPYRKSDIEAPLVTSRHSYFAAHGYASIDVDLRGSGDSDGVLVDEYLPLEQIDALDVLSWLADQPWCTGDVGMIGISWGGFNTLQIAARRPPELKAIVTCMGADDRYSDDVHFIGGSLLANCGPPWATTMLMYSTLPPDPVVVGDDWRRMWMERLEGSVPMHEPWLSHLLRDEYWKQGSICEDFSTIDCAVYAVDGWADGYHDAVFHLLEHLDAPRKGLIGPWFHGYPHDGEASGPAIGFLQECLRWWDHWLKGVDNGIMEEPMLRAWMQDPVEPSTWYAERPGTWIAERSWPQQPDATAHFVLNAQRDLAEVAAPEARIDHRGSEATGQDGGFWCSFGNPGDWPPDQRGDEARSLTFTSPPLDAPLHVFGAPVLQLALAVDRPVAQLAVRLSDVWPDGRSTLVTRGFLNLTHRQSHETAEALVPGARYEVAISLQTIAQLFPTGHRLRVAVSTEYWPWIWPSPEPVVLSLFAGSACSLELPLRTPRGEDAALPAFEAPEAGPQEPHETLYWKSGRRWNVSRLEDGSHEQIHHFDDFCHRFPDGLEVDLAGPDTYTIVEGEPLTAKITSERRWALRRGQWTVRTEADSVMTADRDEFHVDLSFRAFEGDDCVWHKDWRMSFPRIGV